MVVTCGEPATLCTVGGEPLSATIAHTVEGPEVAQVTPFTAKSTNGPGTPDGSSRFTVHLLFSEEPANVRNNNIKDALNITGAAKSYVRIVDGTAPTADRDRPEGNGDVTLSLGPTTDCAAANALCTEDGRKRESLISIKIAGPAAAPARAHRTVRKRARTARPSPTCTLISTAMADRLMEVLGPARGIGARATIGVQSLAANHCYESWIEVEIR